MEVPYLYQESEEEEGGLEFIHKFESEPGQGGKWSKSSKHCKLNIQFGAATAV